MFRKIKMTALQLACYRKDIKLIRNLLTIDSIDINERNLCGETALDIMCRKGESDIANMLIDAGAKLKLRDYTQLINNLLTRTDIQPSELINFFSQIGVNVKDVNKNGDSLIHIACQINNLNMLKMLNNSNTELNIQNEVGETPLHIAVRNGNMEIIKYLIECGANLNIQNNLGQTALHIAFEQGDYGSVKELIETGAKLDIPDIVDRKPLDIPVSNNFYALQIFRLNLINLETYCKSSNFKAIEDFLYTNKLDIYKILAVKFMLESKEKSIVKYTNPFKVLKKIMPESKESDFNIMKRNSLLKHILKCTNKFKALRWSLYYNDYKTFHYILLNGNISLNDLTVRFGQDTTLIDIAHMVCPNAVEFLEAKIESLEKNCGAKNKNIANTNLVRINDKRCLERGL